MNRTTIMLSRTALTVALLLAGALVAAAAEPDLSGVWTMTMEGDSPTAQESIEMTFEVDGESLVAIMKGEGEDVRCEGTVKGNEVRFTYSRATDDGTYEALYVGHFAGDLMGGEVDLGEHGKTSWRAIRGE